MNILQQNPTKIYTRPKSIARDYMSHELRISLTGILGASHLLDQTELSDQQQLFVKLIGASAKRLVALADKIK